MTRDDKKDSHEPSPQKIPDLSLGSKLSMKPRIRVRCGTVGPIPKRRKKPEPDAHSENTAELEDISLRKS
jgi:hypothetical protein